MKNALLAALCGLLFAPVAFAGDCENPDYVATHVDECSSSTRAYTTVPVPVPAQPATAAQVAECFETCAEAKECCHEHAPPPPAPRVRINPNHITRAQAQEMIREAIAALPQPEPHEQPKPVDEAALEARVKAAVLADLGDVVTAKELDDALDALCADPTDDTPLCVTIRDLRSDVDDLKKAGGSVWTIGAGFVGVFDAYGDHPSDAHVARHLYGGELLVTLYGWRNGRNGHGFEIQALPGLAGGNAPAENGNSRSFLVGGRACGAFDAKSFEILPCATVRGGISGILDKDNFRTGHFVSGGGSLLGRWFMEDDLIGFQLGLDVTYGPRHIGDPEADIGLVSRRTTFVGLNFGAVFRTRSAAQSD